MVRLVACKISCGNEILIYYCYVIGRWISVSLCQLGMFCPLSKAVHELWWLFTEQKFEWKSRKTTQDLPIFCNPNFGAGLESSYGYRLTMEMALIKDKQLSLEIWLWEQNQWLALSKGNRKKKLYQQCDHCQQVIMSGRCDSTRTAHKSDSTAYY